MSAYIVSLVICAVAAAFICTAAPSNGGLNKFVSFLASLVIVCVIISPLTKNLSFDFNTEISYDTTEIETDYNKIAAESLAGAISDTVKSKFGISVKNVTVTVYDGSQFNVEKVSIDFGDYKFDKSVICEYLSELYNCKVVVSSEE